MTSKPGGLFALLSVVFIVACESTPTDVRTISAPSGEYTVRVVGAGDWPRYILAYRTVRAEVTGRDFQAVLPLYAGDGMDSSFDARFADPVWVSNDVVRWPSRTRDRLNSLIVIENRSDTLFPSIRVRYADLILLLRVAPGAVLSIPTTDWWVSDYPEVEVDAYDAAGRTLASAEARADLRSWDAASASIQIVLSDPDQIGVSISPR
jgi:hypothetical protein